MSLVKLLAIYAVASNSVDIPESIEQPPVQQAGIATVYGRGGFHGSVTASGEKFEPYEEQTCAHKELPLGSVILVENPENGKRVWCRVNDRGPYVVEDAQGQDKAVTPKYTLAEGEQWVRILDLSVKAGREIGIVGIGQVEIRYFTAPVSTDRTRLAFRP